MIRTERDEDGLLDLVIDLEDRPFNVLDTGLVEALSEAVEAALADEAVRGILLRSERGDLLVGADLQEIWTWLGPDAEGTASRARRLGDVLRRMETGGKPVGVVIDGQALGGGLEVCLACHHRVAVDRPGTRLGLPEVTLQLLPGAGGTQRLPRLVGAGPALDLMLGGKPVGVARAVELGLVDDAAPTPEQARVLLRERLLADAEATQPWDRRGFRPPGAQPNSAEHHALFTGWNARVLSQDPPAVSARRAILRCVYEGLPASLDGGLARERRHFLDLLRHPAARNVLRTTFFGLRRARRAPDRPERPATRLERIGIVGGGLMGAGVAQVCAMAGLRVVVVDVALDQAEAAREAARKRLDRAVSRGRLSAEDRDAALGRIQPAADVTALAGSDLVLEAIVEDVDAKRELLGRLEAVLGPHIPLATNTSSLPLGALARDLAHPARLVGLHFFSPVDRMKLVEVIQASRTDAPTLAAGLDLCRILRKVPIVVGDGRGFYTTRVFNAYLTEAFAMLDEGLPLPLIEAAGRHAGMPVPPLQLADIVGLDVMRHVLAAAEADPEDWVPAAQGPLLRHLVDEHGRTGRKGGGGFYDWTAEGPRPWGGLPASTRADAPVGALAERLILAQVADALRLLEAGRVRRPRDADLGGVFGWGFPAALGGPVSHADTLGPARLLERLETLHEAHGDRFAPTDDLRRRARDHTPFHDPGTPPWEA
jgi:3-hydroxyacyl-CoA dehydrogenase / enoyl-CoA hydratase / 3-hydroxybutyryl-CoA epimerase